MPGAGEIDPFVRDSVEATMVLSDITITVKLANGELIVAGDPAFIGPCSYQFRPGKIFTGGEDAKIIDWTNPPPNEKFVIKPGAMVWIRMREYVNLPDNNVPLGGRQTL